MWYDQTGLKWLAPSPNIPSLDAAILYPGTCLFEGTNLSEGRGTMKPFENIGAPYIDGAKWAKALNEMNLKGVAFEAVEFTPKSISNMATRPKRLGEKCGGVLVKVTDREVLEPVKVGVAMLVTAKKLYPDSLKWRDRSIDRLSGTPKLRKAIDAGASTEKIVEMWKSDVEQFKKVRAKHLLY
jgi:uncharacterized protein YbbC (DUF1343 family)